MDNPSSHNDLTRIAEAVRDACARAAAEAYDDAGVQGLCAEGRWEVALEAIRRVDVRAVISSIEGHTGSAGQGPSGGEG